MSKKGLDQKAYRKQKGVSKDEPHGNDYTKSVPDWVFEQEDQTISDVPQFSCGGMGKAHKGGKFIGCK